MSARNDDGGAAPALPDGGLRRVLGPAAFVVLVLGYYALVVSDFGAQPFGQTRHGLAFNAVALNLLQGRFDVDPAFIGEEAFVRDGRSYVYFGIFPSLLRLPLVPFLDISALPLARLSLFLALATGALAQAATAWIAVAGALRNGAGAGGLVRDRLVLAALLSGPAIMLARNGAPIYDESIAWSWALASVFVAVAVRGALREGGYGAGQLVAMAMAAGLCLLTRPTTAFGLHVALALLMLWQAFRPAPAGVPDRPLLRRLFQAKLVAAAGVVAVFILAAAVVNHGRWGDPFLFADVRQQVHLTALYPDRLPRLDAFGLFNLQRLGYGLSYYFVPLWVIPVGEGLLWQDRILELFDAFELPPSSFFLSDPLTMALAAIGLPALLAGRVPGLPRAPGLMLGAGLAVAPAMMLVAWYMAFRYRLDFQPLLFLLACCGAAVLTARAAQAGPPRLRRISAVLGGLLVLQVVSAQIHAIAYDVSAFGSIHMYNPAYVLEPFNLWAILRER